MGLTFLCGLNIQQPDRFLPAEKQKTNKTKKRRKEKNASAALACKQKTFTIVTWNISSECFFDNFALPARAQNPRRNVCGTWKHGKRNGKWSWSAALLFFLIKAAVLYNTLHRDFIKSFKNKIVKLENGLMFTFFLSSFFRAEKKQQFLLNCYSNPFSPCSNLI